MLPNVTFNSLDNQIGRVDDGGERLAIVGVSSGGSGLIDTPGIYARRTDVVAAFGAGPLVEAACYIIEQVGRPVVLCKSDVTTVGAYGAVTHTGAGTSVVTTDATVEPYDSYEVRFKFLTAGTIGVTGITYQYSVDDGRTYSAVQSLGTDSDITLADYNVKIEFAAGTILANQEESFRTTEPLSSTSDRAAAMLALRSTANAWTVCLVDGNLVAADVAAIATEHTAAQGIGRESDYVGSFRVPNAGESEATYKAAWDTAFSASAEKHLTLCYGAAEIQSPQSQNRYLRRISWDIAAAIIAVRPGQDIAEVRLGPRPASVRILDESSNPKHHDERFSPGPSDSRATVYRTWERRDGVYVNDPLVLSPTGSDYRNTQHGRVMSLARRTARAVLELSCSADILVNRKTGFILEEDASAIDSEVNAALGTLVVDPRNATDAVFQLSRTDNLLSTFKLRGALRVTPLGYPKAIEVDVSFFNPALRAVFPEA